MEPIDQLDVPNRRLPEGRLRRFAKRNPASPPFSFFLVNPSLFSASSSELAGVGSRDAVLRGSLTVVGTVPPRDVSPALRRTDCPSSTINLSPPTELSKPTERTTASRSSRMCARWARRCRSRARYSAKGRGSHRNLRRIVSTTRCAVLRADRCGLPVVLAHSRR